ncbi:MAG: cytochrome c3 family protein [Candidatus Marinimicrobia bacterium]|nr:cytochrome c3 family protein [Candidatus Neomarinimicrobiota bacterium]
MSGNYWMRWSKSYGLILLTGLAGLIALTGYSNQPDPTQGERFYLRNSGGDVLFDHQTHKDQTEGCETCHHNLFNADFATECFDCHDEDMMVEDFTHAEMKEIEDHECFFCHELHEDREATNCRQCHPTSEPEYPTETNCASCHDSDYSREMLSHEEMLETHEDDCAGCHHLQTLSSIYHLQCVGCHEQEVVKIAGKCATEWECSACHLK